MSNILAVSVCFAIYLFFRTRYLSAYVLTATTVAMWLFTVKPSFLSPINGVILAGVAAGFWQYVMPVINRRFPTEKALLRRELFISLFVALCIMTVVFVYGLFSDGIITRTG